jgi:aspartate/methionine/tyrosine aminotransferase
VEEAAVFRNLNINYFSCVPPYNQEGARVALESPLGREAIGAMVAAFQRRRDLVVNGLNAIPGIRCQRPKGAFYVFPNIAGACEHLGVLEAYERLPEALRARTSPSTLFQMFLLFEHRVAALDRKSFGRIGAEPYHYLRLSIATDTESLQEGLKRIEAAARDRDGFQKFLARGEHLA